MAQQYRPGEIVPQSGIYTITHDPAHADGELETMLAGVHTASGNDTVELAHEGLEVELA